MALFPSTTNDFLLGFYLNTAAVQGRFLRLEQTLDTILNYHEYPPVIAQFLAETLSLAAILIAQLKNEARVTLQIKSKGLIKLLVVDINDKGDIRGYAEYDPVLNTEKKAYSFTELVHSTDANGSCGTLVVTFDQAESSKLFQGIVALQENSLADSMVHYFKQSVQQDVCLLTQTRKDDNNKWQSATLFLQKNAVNAGESDDQWNYSKLLVKTIKDKELLQFDKPAHDVLINVFHEQEVYFQPCKSIKAHCGCSREKIQTFVEQWTQEEKDDLKENGQLEIRCEFCNTSYNFA